MVINMFTWKLEDMALMNENCNTYIGTHKMYNAEITTAREEKIAFVDSMTDGLLSYILELIEKFNKVKDSLPKTNYGDVKTVSLKAWINKNDTKYSQKIIDDWYHYGKYRILGCERHITNDYKGTYDIYDDLVDEVFHRQLLECEKCECRYFKEHDEYEVLKDKLRNTGYDTTFGVRLSFSSNNEIYILDDDDNKREITIDEIKILLDKYEQLDRLVENLTKEIHIVY